MFEIEKMRGFSSVQDYNAFSVVRLHSKIINQIGGRNTWVKISNSENQIYRMALGAKPSEGFTTKAIELDYDSCLEIELLSKEGYG